MSTIPTPPLLPCPFCGGEVIYKQLPDEVHPQKVWWRPECTRCEAILNNGWPTKEEAADEWNERYVPDDERSKRLGWPLHRRLRDAAVNPDGWDIPGLLRAAAAVVEGRVAFPPAVDCRDAEGRAVMGDESV